MRSYRVVFVNQSTFYFAIFFLSWIMFWRVQLLSIITPSSVLHALRTRKHATTNRNSQINSKNRKASAATVQHHRLSGKLALADTAIAQVSPLVLGGASHCNGRNLMCRPSRAQIKITPRPMWPPMGERERLLHRGSIAVYERSIVSPLRRNGGRFSYVIAQVRNFIGLGSRPLERNGMDVEKLRFGWKFREFR